MFRLGALPVSLTIWLCLTGHGGNVLALPQATSLNTCDAVLIPDVTQKSSDRALSLSWLKVASFDQYTDKNRNGSLNAIYNGFSVGVSSSEFESNKRSYLTEEQFMYDERDSRSYFHRGITDLQAQKWAECQQSQSGGAIVALAVRNVAEDNRATLWVQYRSVAGHSARVTIAATGGTLSLNNGPFASSVVIPTMSDRVVSVLQLRRSPQQRMLITANAETKTGPEAAGDATFPLPYRKRKPPVCTASVRIQGIAATASTFSESAPRVVDNNRTTLWNSQRAVPGNEVWIDLTLPSISIVTRLDLYPESPTSNMMTNRFSAFDATGRTETVLGTLSTVGVTGGMMTFVVPETVGRNIKKIRVQGLTWVNWVAWREIEVYGCR